MGKAQRITKTDITERGLRFCTWDLETTGLNGSYGRILCGAIKPLNRKARVFRIDDYTSYKATPWDDKQLVKDLRDELEQYNVAIGHNSVRFDCPMLNTRLIRHKLKVLSPTVKHLDTIFATRYRMLLSSASLESLLMHIQARARKTKLDPETWARAAAGDRASLDYIVEHNIADVDSLEEAFEELIPFIDLKFRLIS